MQLFKNGVNRSSSKKSMLWFKKRKTFGKRLCGKIDILS